MSKNSFANYYKQIICLLSNKDFQFVAVFAGAYILAHKIIEDLLASTIIKHIFSKIESSWSTDLVLTLSIIISITTVFKKIGNYQSSTRFLFFLVLLSSIYVYYRLFSKVWNFTSFNCVRLIKYLDIVVVITIEVLILKFAPLKQPPYCDEHSFFDDVALRENSKDAFGYNEYAKELAKMVLASNFESSFAIGINGKWGSGKTSFVNLMKKNLTKKESIIEIDFNPWNSLTPQAIINDFFEILLEAIRPYNATLPRLLKTYSKKLVELNKNTVTEYLQTSVSLITGFNSLNQLFSDIDTQLKSLNKKLVIYIDDIDRLNKEEILEIIRLIRNSANFRNTFFIVAYDRNYVIKALDSHNPYNHEQFLEKILQVEISLPYYDKNVLKSRLADNLKKLVPQSYHAQIDETIIGSDKFAAVSFANWLETMRDVTRLSNSVALNLKRLLGEVELSDFLQIEILRLKYPSVYELIYLKTSKFLKPIQKNTNIFVYQLSPDVDLPKDSNEKRYEKYLQRYLEENSVSLSVPKSEVEPVFTFIRSIFSDHYANSYINRPKLSIIFPSKFKRYFAYTLLNDNLSEIEFGNSRSLSQENFNSTIFGWLEKGLVREVQTRFEQIQEYDNREDFEKVIKSIFYFAGIQYEGTNRIVDFNRMNLFQKISDSDVRTSILYGENKDSYKEFITNLFLAALPPYRFEREFIASIMESHDNYGSFPLTKDELNAIALNYLKQYVKSIEKIDLDLFQLFWCTKKVDLVTDNGHTYFKQSVIPEEAKTIMAQFILEKDREGFANWMINEYMPGKGLYTISETAETIFKGWSNFEVEFINSINTESNSLTEFKTFYLKFKEKNFQEYIPFTFKYIDISNRK